MSKRLGAFAQAIVFILSFFINLYCTKLATVYDPELRGVELLVMGGIAMGCIIGFFYHLGVAITFKPVKGAEYENY